MGTISLTGDKMNIEKYICRILQVLAKTLINVRGNFIQARGIMIYRKLNFSFILKKCTPIGNLSTHSLHFIVSIAFIIFFSITHTSSNLWQTFTKFSSTNRFVIPLFHLIQYLMSRQPRIVPFRLESVKLNGDHTRGFLP